VFEKNEESSQYLKPLYVQGHIDGRPIFRMLIDGGTAVNLMSYYVFKKLGREDVELMKTNLTLNCVCVCVCVCGGGGNPMEPKGVISIELIIGNKSRYRFLRCRGAR
jgi:hypothetical protein